MYTFQKNALDKKKIAVSIHTRLPITYSPNPSTTPHPYSPSSTTVLSLIYNLVVHSDCRTSDHILGCAILSIIACHLRNMLSLFTANALQVAQLTPIHPQSTWSAMPVLGGLNGIASNRLVWAIPIASRPLVNMDETPLWDTQWWDSDTSGTSTKIEQFREPNGITRDMNG